MKTKIKSLSEKYYSSILPFFYKDNFNNKKSLILESSESLLDLDKNINYFLDYLWKKPDFIAKLLICSDLNDSNNILFPLFFNRFYQNILSSSFIEQNLLYVITILFKNEISKNDFDEINFLENSKIDFLFSVMRNIIEIKKYAKNIIFEVIKKLEYDKCDKLFEINFDGYNENEMKELMNIDNNQYLISITKSELEKFVNNEDQNMNEYIYHLIKMIENHNNNELFSNSILIKKYSPKIITHSYKIQIPMKYLKLKKI